MAEDQLLPSNDSRAEQAEVPRAPTQNSLSSDELEDLLGQLRSEEEKARVQALLALQGHQGTYPSALVEHLDRLLQDPSRIVREQARVLSTRIQTPRARALEALGAAHLPENASPANGLLALLSLGSASSGLLLTVMSLIQYYTLGGFPFPSPVEVLFWLNLGLTFPHLALGIALLLPGRGQKRLAVSWAWISGVAGLSLALLARPIFEQLWMGLFTPAMQLKYQAFLSPGTVGAAIAPLLVGQAMLIYFGSAIIRKEEAAEGTPT